MTTARLTVPRTLPGARKAQDTSLIKALIFGPSGAGKTRFALSFCKDPRTNPVLWLDHTGGTTGVQDEANALGAEIRSCGDMGEVQKVIDYLKVEDHPYKTVIFDDFSEAFGLTKNAIAKELGLGTSEDLTWQSYAKLYERTLNRIRGFVSLASPKSAGGGGVHVIVTCWSEKEKDRDENELWVPQFSGKFGLERVPGYFDLVGFLEHKVKVNREGGNQQRTFTNRLITMSQTHLVKDRFDSIPGGVLDAPTAAKLLDAWDAKHAANNAASK
jgi:adenylate kinase family enzyme